MTPEQKVRISMTGAVLLLAGFLFTWYSVTFSPPGGSVVINDHRWPAFAHTFNGVNESDTMLGAPLRVTTLGLVISALLGASGVARRIHRRFPKSLHAIFGSSVMAVVASTLRAAAHVLLALGIVGLLLLFVVLSPIGLPQRLAAEMGGGPAALHASHYLSVHIGLGLWLMLGGLLVSATTMLREIGYFSAVFFGGTVVLAFVHPAWLTPFYQLVGDWFAGPH